jgi:hypothetical protein
MTSKRSHRLGLLAIERNAHDADALDGESQPCNSQDLGEQGNEYADHGEEQYCVACEQIV